MWNQHRSLVPSYIMGMSNLNDQQMIKWLTQIPVDKPFETKESQLKQILWLGMKYARFYMANW